ncbi:MAG: hypothetical protein J6P21_04605 [Clostridia bacterium]|nr:hypothetical protein [Clostridia bacterium]
MSKKNLNDNEIQKISAGNGWKKFNRALDYTSAGIEAVAGIATYLVLSAEDRKDAHDNGHGFFGGVARSVKNNPSCLLPLMMTVHGVWRIASRACDFYDDENKNNNN